MSTSLTTSPTTLDTGSAGNLHITNSSTDPSIVVDVQRGGLSLGRLNNGRSIDVQPEGNAVTAQTTAGTGQVDVVVTGASTPVQTVAASGATLTLSDGYAAYDITLSANCTLTFPTAKAGKRIDIVVRQDATGSRTLTYPASVKWAAATAPVLSTGASKVDLLVFNNIDGTNWLGTNPAKDLR